ncbi:dihydrodipicolinate synthase family protein [Xenorhabdus nematophila]|uniref:Dihydrodipicolinate synthetase n=1 Tax=Xenorhabdus nematophila (strain ATCC 19061 / DSM 3370 / CCUG 14189 / LMG 1036 / NCIMB 9965 / AN6) TaxID=406817 RepID=D3VFM1_XENNA|nr:dihydrodipicolinate synthase family protein [Xenorhabdus nematophila]CEE89927.1 Dihydrodipicolinate synthetase [Xenorhabdus nematophila str. Anatoliense]CEF29293.1 Dihydrodipicolinate synthetase [Xenorhabdus nematophila str. Websteri]AYA40207.1 dihydrodipicolinate synthase family protein [Xenorhabdus nematophila]KHD27815.1 dihydrodipicolinate synthase [Xenorhabdus nematophila]MBA0018877.1 dihydrodipicolinate synthase family protein [Xenorhabdus nematophila]
MSTPDIHGIIGYTITSFTPDGNEVDFDALGLSIDRLIDSGVHAVAPLGSTGEGAYLSDHEWEQISEFSIKHVAGRVPTIVSVSDLTTAKAVQRARFAEEHGADVVMVLPTSYWKLTEDEILAHYQAISDNISVPIMLYNNPATSGIDMSVELILRIINTVENVTMVKESTGDIQRMHKLQQLSKRQVPFYNGCNPLALEALVAGARGWCTAAPNLIPQLNLDLYSAVQNNDLERARDLFYRQLPLLDFILKGGLPATIKAGLRLTGLEAGNPRLPVFPLSDAGCEQLQQMLTDLR